MTAKEYLGQYEDLKKELNRSERRLSEKREVLYGKGINSCSSEGKQASRGNATEAALLNLIEREETVNTLRDRLMLLEIEMESMINKLSDDIYIDILMRKYLSLQPWKSIIAELGYTEQYVYELHGKALKAFSTKLL